MNDILNDLWGAPDMGNTCIILSTLLTCSLPSTPHESILLTAGAYRCGSDGRILHSPSML